MVVEEAVSIYLTTMVVLAVVVVEVQGVVAMVLAARETRVLQEATVV
jgi:hypothetical protein